MLKDDPWSNPGMLDADRGEALWKEKRGPKTASLEQCDLGKGPGKVDGAFAELPRYFADADRVMDLETRLLWCRETLQGLSTADYVKRPHPAGGQPVKEIGAIATYVASKSSGQKFAAEFNKPQEQEAVALGEALFYRRSGPFDVACATCHAQSGLRIRLQGLPYLTEKKEASKVIGEWPAYRVSNTHVMTMQHRLLDEIGNQRHADVGAELELGHAHLPVTVIEPMLHGHHLRRRHAIGRPLADHLARLCRLGQVRQALQPDALA